MANVFSIIIPLFNEQETLEYTHSRISKLAHDPTLKTFDRIEIIYVNDGSRDRSEEILETIKSRTASSNLVVETVLFSRNFGHSSAVLAGLEHCTGDVIAIIDADLQDPPELLPKMYQEVLNGFDVVYGQRIRRKGESVFKKISAWTFYRTLTFLTQVPIPADTGDFRIITREVCDAVLECKEHEPFLRGIVAWVGFKQKAFPYERDSRQFGETKYPLRKMLAFAGKAILSFSSTPLLISVWLGLAGLVCCFGVSIWAFIRHSQGHTVSGWTSLFIGFMYGQSMTFMLLGILGVYLSRMFTEAQGRPRYIVKKAKTATKTNLKRVA